MIRSALLQEVRNTFGGSVARFAEHYNIKRPNAHRILRDYGISPDDYRAKSIVPIQVDDVSPSTSPVKG